MSPVFLKILSLIPGAIRSPVRPADIRHIKKDGASRFTGLLPRGGTLTDQDWAGRHRWMMRVLWAHVVMLLSWRVIMGLPMWYSTLDVVSILMCGALAGISRWAVASAPR